jgi:hypothetical protein
MADPLQPHSCAQGVGRGPTSHPYGAFEGDQQLLRLPAALRPAPPLPTVGLLLLLWNVIVGSHSPIPGHGLHPLLLVWPPPPAQALARTWNLHKTYPSGPREFWESHGDMLTLTETLASHAALFGEPASGKAPQPAAALPFSPIAPAASPVQLPPGGGMPAPSPLVVPPTQVRGGACGGVCVCVDRVDDTFVLIIVLWCMCCRRS